MNETEREETKRELVQTLSSRALEILTKRSEEKYGKAVEDIIPTIEGNGTWIGGYRDGTPAERKTEPKLEVVDPKLEVSEPKAAAESQTPPEQSKSRSSSKKVRFSNEATVKYAEPPVESTADDDWEDIEYLDDEGPSYDDAVKISSESAKKIIDEARFSKRKDQYEKIELDDPDFNDKLHDKYFPDLPTNPTQLSWMSNKIPEVPAEVSYDSLDDLRFDFDGNIITSENIGKYSEDTAQGLHHHSAHPELPGYTLPELSEYLRSTYPGQRSMASRTLGRIMYKLGKLCYSVTEVSDDKTNRKAEGTEGIFEKKCWELIIQLEILDLLNQSAADTEKNLTVRNYALDALWLWNEANGEDICKKVSAEMEKERELYQV